MTIEQKIHVCPYHRQEIDRDESPKNEAALTDKVFQTGHSIFQFIGENCPYAKDVANWAKNSFSYYYDGNIPALFKIMRIGDTQSYERFKTVPIAHKFKCIVVTDPIIIEQILSKFRDGKEWSGGPEFVAVRYVTGGTNPLTEKDKSRQGILKSFTMNNHFSPASIKDKTLEFMAIADKFVENTYDETEEFNTYNITQSIPEYTLDISAKIILGVDDDYSELIDAIGALESLATDMILYNPNAFIPDILKSDRANSQDELKRAVHKIVQESEDGQGITARMQQEPRFSKQQASHLKKIHNEVSSEVSSEMQIIKKIYNFITSKYYQSHFFEIADEQQLEIPYLRQLAELEKDELNDIRGDFFESLQLNGELNSFLDIVSMMIANKDSQKFDQRQIADIVKTVLIIGSGTTKSAIVSSLYCLLQHPEEQEKLYLALKKLELNIPTEEELKAFQSSKLDTINNWQFAGLLDIDDDMINKDPRYEEYIEIRDIPREELNEEQFELIKHMKLKSVNNLIHSKLMKCPELEDFISEVMRMFPPIAVQARLAKQEVQVKDLTIPEGWTVFLANILSYNDETRWENPQTFNPSRFQDPSTPRIHPFNYGINQCMGRFQALSSIKAILYTLLMKYKILPPINIDDEEIEQNFILSAGVALKFDKPLWARFEERR